MNLAYKYPIMFWNCACLINDSGGTEDEDEDDEAEIETETPEEIYVNEMEEFSPDDSEEDIEDSYDEDEDCDGYPVEVCKMKDGKKKKKTKTTNYGKISTAIGKMKSSGIDVATPDINFSSYTFSPDVNNNVVRYGLSGITRIGEDLIKEIINKRPYTSLSDFLSKVKINKPQMINLIKAGAFDSFGDRVQIMHEYINTISDTKKRITLQNLNMLIDFGLIPDEFDLERRVFKFNKYLKKFKDGDYYILNNIAFGFYSNNFDLDNLETDENAESGFKIRQLKWDNIYQHHMNIIRPFVQKNNADLLSAVNNKLTEELWNKYCLGSISKWEMDSVSYYSHEHELAHFNGEPYEVVDFGLIPENPVVDRVIPIKGKLVPILKLYRIAGTVLDRDKAKKTVTLLTTDGVVTVKIYGNQFADYDKQISERGADGKKHVIRKSEFSRGNKIIITGVRDGDFFRGKKYKNTPYHLLETIESIDDNGIITTFSRHDEI